jgi:SAM-dependent methyltransferase
MRRGSTSVLTALLALVTRPVEEIDAVDVGAGTGIWSAMLASRGCRTVTAVEPNDDMRTTGERINVDSGIEWRRGGGEHTGLPSGSADLLTTASSFHWMDFDQATSEFARVLRPGGRFAALWNPRLIEANPVLAEIEAHLHVLCPTLTRVSSGRSGVTDRLTDLLCEHPAFDDVIYIEGRHTGFQTVVEYLGAWRSVNDVQVQLGSATFANFLGYVQHRLDGLPGVSHPSLGGSSALTPRRTP